MGTLKHKNEEKKRLHSIVSKPIELFCPNNFGQKNFLSEKNCRLEKFVVKNFLARKVIF